MTKILLSVHRILGTFLSGLFLMWFLSGFVMLFRSFPSISPVERVRGLADIVVADSSGRAELDSLLRSIPPSGLRSLSLRATPAGRGYVLSYSTQDSTGTAMSSGQAAPSYQTARAYAERFSDAPIQYVDTLMDVDTWVPYRRGDRVYPLYRFHYADSLGTELSVPKATAEGIQLTTRETRLWAYLGAIPHWIYFSSLRQHRDLWVGVITAVSALGFVMCLAGVWLGIRGFWLGYRSRRRLCTPYKKWDYRWHHILGFVFGLSVSAYIFSGLMSVQEVPQSVLRREDGIRQALQVQTFGYPAEAYLRDVDIIMSSYADEGVKSIEWRSLGQQGYIHLMTAGGSYHLETSTGQARPLQLGADELRSWLDSTLEHPYTMSLLREYDSYYIDRHHDLPLPVYRIELSDSGKTRIYIDPQTARVQVYDQNKRLHHLLYQGLHTMSFAPLVRYSWLWWTAVLSCLVGGALVSATGLILGVRYLRRRRRR